MIHPYRSRVTAVGALAAGLAALALTAGTLPAPPAAPPELVDWWASTDPALALGALLHTMSTVICGYLLVVTLVDLVATLAGMRPLARVARCLAPAAWRAIVLRPVTLGTLALPTVLGPVATAAPAVAEAAPSADVDAAAEPGDAVITMSWRGTTDPAPATTSTTSTTSTTTTTAPPEASPPTSAPPTTVLPEEHGIADHTHGEDPGPAAPVAAGDAATPPDAATFADDTADDRYVVRRGDSLWRIAASRVKQQVGRAPSAGEVHGYWRELIAANEHRLPVPGDPDLIFPGDELVLPPAG